MNPWEANALQYHYQDDSESATTAGRNLGVDPKDTVHDTVIYPGLYAPSGFDMMSILVRVMERPRPVIELGPIDSSCALLMCDLQQPDCPVVYASDPFMELTGYSHSEVIGRNCRFLQAPGGKVRKSSHRQYVDKDLVKRMKRAIETNQEIAVEITNFKKNGQRFTNLLTMIPVCWDSSKPRYSVGFQAEKTW
ncbi:putative vivid protein [Whalleya microplaca]|nr:putative vivid protein [Whalleya microplaca]